MLDKINIVRIVADHVRTLRDYGTGRLSYQDIFLFFAIPILFATALCWSGKLLSAGAINMLMQAYAILVGLLLNLLVLIFTAIRREANSHVEPSIATTLETKRNILRETFANLSFCVLLGIVIAMIVLLGLLHNSIIKYTVNFIVYAGSLNFVLTLLMVLKRVHSLLGHEFKD